VHGDRAVLLGSCERGRVQVHGAHSALPAAEQRRRQEHRDGDFNHDGKTDVAFANSSGFSPEQQNCAPQGCVSVLLGKGDATFASVACQLPLTGTSCRVNYPTGGEPYFGTGSLADADLNEDGNTDLVVANVIGTGDCNLGCLSILYGNSNGTFQAPIEINTGTSPEAVVVGDFNGDGRPDIAMATFNSVTVLLNQGNDAAGHATFAPSSGSPFLLAGDPNGPVFGMTTADLTGHGKVDLVLSGQFEAFGSATCATQDCVQMLTNKNDGSGNFNAAVAHPVDGSGEVTAAPLRGTALDDVIVPGGGGFQVLLNQGNGTLGAPSAPFTYPGAEVPQAVAVADFNNDGKLDVAIADFDSSITVLFKGNGNGTFTFDDTVSDPTMMQGTDDSLAAGDFNGDCKPDLALGSDNGLIVMRNDTPPAGSACPPPPAPPPPPPSSTKPAPAALAHWGAVAREAQPQAPPGRQREPADNCRRSSEGVHQVSRAPTREDRALARDRGQPPRTARGQGQDGGRVEVVASAARSLECCQRALSSVRICTSCLAARSRHVVR
jgi:VCBS repeat protein